MLTTRWTLAAAGGLLAWLADGACAAEYKLHHRVYHPSIPNPEYSPRGVLLVAPGQPPSIADAPEYRADMAAFSDAIREALSVDEDVFEVYYQVALERPGDSSPRDYDVSSVRACHLDQTTSQKFIFHLSPHDGVPHAVDYFVAPIPTNGSCPPAFTRGAGPKMGAQFNIREITDTSVVAKTPHAPISPLLKEPPQLSAQGEVVAPMPEKTFFEKYWIYLLGVLLALLIAPGGEEPPSAGQGGGGSGGQARPS